MKSEQPAFPVTFPNPIYNQTGLTKLEYFVAHNAEAVVHIINDISIDTILESLGCPNEIYSFEKHYPKYLAKMQILLTKELLKQLEDEN
jgi:hypothetical protein